MDKKKKIGLIVAGALELAIVIFVITVSVLVTVTFNDPDVYPNYQQLNLEKNGQFIGWLQNNPTYFLFIILIPIFVILALDIIYLVMVATKRGTRKKREKNFLESFSKKKKTRNNDILLFIKPYRGFF